MPSSGSPSSPSGSCTPSSRGTTPSPSRWPGAPCRKARRGFARRPGVRQVRRRALPPHRRLGGGPARPSHEPFRLGRLARRRPAGLCGRGDVHGGPPREARAGRGGGGPPLSGATRHRPRRHRVRLVVRARAPPPRQGAGEPVRHPGPSKPERTDEPSGERAMEVAPIKSTRIYEEIVRQVKQMIAEGRLKSGDRLPPERDLAEKFVVSRSSVREALRALESLGLVEIRAGEGTFVREVSVESLIEPLALMMVAQREAIAELFEARRLLEPGIAALAASRATLEEVAEMERILEEQAKEIAEGRTGLVQDAAFHGAIG